jgi:uncharacterized protein (TIGR02246 family)
MKTMLPVVLLLVCSFATRNVGASETDEEALRQLPKTYCDAWGKHDGHQLAQMMAEDVDYVNVGALWLHGRSDFEKYHSRLLSGRFRESSFTALDTAVRFLRPDLAVVHWSWKIHGDKNYDGSCRPERFGLLMMLVEKRSGKWMVVVAQNTNSMPGSAPEEAGIRPPIDLPQPDERK